MSTAQDRKSVILPILAVIAIGYWASVVFIPIVLSICLYLLLEPLVELLQKKGISRALSSYVLVVLSVASFLVVCWGGYKAFSQVGEEVPRYSKKIHSIVESIQGKKEELQKTTEKYLPSDAKQGSQNADSSSSEGSESMSTQEIGKALLHGVNSVFEGLTILLLIPILGLFFLLDQPGLYKTLGKLCGPQYPLKEVSLEMTVMFRSYFLGNMLVGFITAAGFFAFFSILGLNNGFALAMVAGFINLIPIVGSILAALPPFAQAILQFDTMSNGFLIFGASIFLHFFVANFVIPKVVGTKINVNSVASTIGLIFWGWLWGGIGLLLAVPLVAAMRILLAAHPSSRNFANLLAEKSVSAK